MQKKSPEKNRLNALHIRKSANNSKNQPIDNSTLHVHQLGDDISK